MEQTEEGSFEEATGVWREYPYTYDQAAQDLFTYGPLDVVKKILLGLDLEGYVKVCGMNPRLRDICRDPNFQKAYFERNSKEILGILKSTVENEEITKSEEMFYLEWSRIAGNKWNPAKKDNRNIRFAAEGGFTDAIKLLLRDQRVDPGARDNEAIQRSAADGHTSVVKLLLQDHRVDPTANESYALAWAAENGQTKVVELLLKDGRADPSARRNFAIKVAAENGHAKVVALLLKDGRADPSANKNHALVRATNNGTKGIVKLLLQDPRVIKKGLQGALSMVQKRLTGARRGISAKEYADIAELLEEASK